MNSDMSSAKQPGVHDVLARKPVNDVVALNNYLPYFLPHLLGEAGKGEGERDGTH
jgi:hypothetical protein